MNKKLIVGLMAAALTLSSAAVCSAEEAKDSVTLTDTLGREVTVELPIENAYLGFYYENFLAVVGPDAFTKVGVTSLYDTDGYFATLSEVFRENVDGYADMVDIGSTENDTFDVEKLIEEDPDVAIVGNYQYETIPDAMDKLEEAGIPVVCIDYSSATEEMHTLSTQILGQLFQCEDRAQEILDLYLGRISEVKERVAEVAEKRTCFHEFDSTISSYSELGQSDYKDKLTGQYLADAGAQDLAADMSGDGWGVHLDLEYVLDQDPDTWFIIGGEAAGDDSDGVLMGYNVTEEELLASAEGMVEARPGFENIAAVKNNEIYCIDNGTLRTLRDYVVIEYMAKCLYPELFEDVDPIADYKEYGEKYLPSIPQDGIFFYNYQYSAE